MATTRSSVQDYGKTAADAAEAAAAGVKAVHDSVSSMADEARQAAGPIIDTVRDRAQQLGAQAHELADDAYQHGRTAVRAVNRQVEEQPLLAVLAAFAIGYGVSYLLHAQR
jgi:ElaB/YqjD/DUF883 family membrane-anchored ribosome-binding protein